MDTAGREISISGFTAGPVRFKVCKSINIGTMFVAPIEQDMLFGMDLTRKGSCVLDLGKGTLTFEDCEIKLNLCSSEEKLKIVSSKNIKT